MHFTKEEYELLRLITIDGGCSGNPIATWRKQCKIRDPPLWSELASLRCCGKCSHFLLLLSIDSWLGYVKIISLTKHSQPVSDSFFDKLHRIQDFIYQKEFTKSYKENNRRVKRRINFVFLNHIEESKFKPSSKPPSGVPFEPLEQLVLVAKGRHDPSGDKGEWRKRKAIVDAEMTQLERKEILQSIRTPSDSDFINVDNFLNESSIVCDEDDKKGQPQDYWQDFHKELVSTVVHTAQWMTEVGLLTDYNAANLAKRGGNETLKGFGESLDQYIGDLGGLLLTTQDPEEVHRTNFIREGLEKGFLRRPSYYPKPQREPDGESLGSSDSSEDSDGLYEDADSIGEMYSQDVGEMYSQDDQQTVSDEDL